MPARDTELDEVARDTLAAMRSIGRACNLDEIYRTLTPRPAYVEVVRAVRRLVKQRLAVRIKHGHRYLYWVAELVRHSSPLGTYRVSC